MTQRILVTGASGFIAKHIILKLLCAGFSVVGSVRSLDRSQEVRDAVAPFFDGDLEAQLKFVALDLNDDSGWNEVLQDVDVLMHTASPFPLSQPSDESDLIRPAVDGTLRALQAAKNASVNRVILTSSIVAVMPSALKPGSAKHNEDNWTNLDSPGLTAYAKSKTLAEQAAWDFVRDQAPTINLTVINPGFVMGPPLDTNFGTSIRVVERLLKAKDPAIPQFGFNCVDVRDIAEMHLRAVQREDTIAQRFIGTSGFIWFYEMAEILKAAYPNRKVVTRRAPNLLVRFLALFDPAIRSIVPILGKKEVPSAQRARDVMGMEFTKAETSLRDTADFLISNKLV